MKVRLFRRTLEIANRVNVDHFKDERLLIGVSYRKSDLKELKNLKDLFLYCVMPYKWLEKKFL